MLQRTESCFASLWLSISGGVIQARAQVMVPQLPLNVARPLPPDLEGGENEVPPIRGVFLNYEPIHTKKWL